MKGRIAAVVFGAVISHTSLACGVCTDVKVAATYDHAVAQRADAVGRTVVFCEIKGPVDARRLGAGARQPEGVDSSSVRISENSAAMSFAIDRQRQSPEKAVVLQRSIPRLQLNSLRVIEPIYAS